MNKSGFTLIETIVAFAIIAVILVVALVGFNTIANVNNRAQAWNQADEQLESMIASGKIDPAEKREATLMVTYTIKNPDGSTSIGEAEIKGEIHTFVYNGKSLEVFIKDPDQVFEGE